MNKNQKTLFHISSIIIGMFCLAFASVPLYNIFCKATGFGGTVKQSNILPNSIGKRNITIYFNSDISPKLHWSFKPAQRKITTIPGKKNLVFYEAQNLDNKISSGTATYNVTPLKAGKYFSKVDCFCFTRQSLQPQQKTTFPVSFYIDPEIENDPFLKDVSEITLSYSFFKYSNKKTPSNNNKTNK